MSSTGTNRVVSQFNELTTKCQNVDDTLQSSELVISEIVIYLYVTWMHSLFYCHLINNITVDFNDSPNEKENLYTQDHKWLSSEINCLMCNNSVMIIKHHTCMLFCLGLNKLLPNKAVKDTSKNLCKNQYTFSNELRQAAGDRTYPTVTIIMSQMPEMLTSNQYTLPLH